MDFEKTTEAISTKRNTLKLPKVHPDVFHEQEIDPTPNILESTLTLGYKLTLLIGLIIMIILLIKSVKNKKNIMKEISLEKLTHVQTKSIILLILSIISCSPIATILTIISATLISNAKKLFENDFGTAKSKFNTATTLNIISIALIVLSFTVLVFILFHFGIQLLHTF